jgi:hypothetical protein
MNSGDDGTRTRGLCRDRKSRIKRLFGAFLRAAPLGQPRQESSSSIEEPLQRQRRIRTESPEALKAIQDFLRFQIEDCRTGDPTDVGLVARVFERS